MDVLTDSSLTLIVKTSEPENANVGESTGESPSLFLQSLFVCQILSSQFVWFFFWVRKLRKNVAALNIYKQTFPTNQQESFAMRYKILKT